LRRIFFAMQGDAEIPADWREDLLALMEADIRGASPSDEQRR